MKRKLKFLHLQKLGFKGIAAINAGADAVYIGAPLFEHEQIQLSVEDIAEW
jgi:putative protease